MFFHHFRVKFYQKILKVGWTCGQGSFNMLKVDRKKKFQ